MAKRPRRNPEPGKFEDPLSNYDEPQVADELERALNDDPCGRAVKTQPLNTVSPGLMIHAAVRMMHTQNINCLIVVDHENKPIGIFTERDCIKKVAADWDAFANRPISEVMTPEPVVITETDPTARVLNLMVSGNFRHVPVVDLDGRVTGLIGPRRLTSYLMKHFENVTSA